MCVIKIREKIDSAQPLNYRNNVNNSVLECYPISNINPSFVIAFICQCQCMHMDAMLHDAYQY